MPSREKRRDSTLAWPLLVKAGVPAKRSAARCRQLVARSRLAGTEAARALALGSGVAGGPAAALSVTRVTRSLLGAAAGPANARSGNPSSAPVPARVLGARATAALLSPRRTSQR